MYRYWLSVGAQASNPVQRLLFRSGLLPPPPMVAMGHKGGERDTHVVDPTTGRCVDAERKPPVMDNELKEEENAEDKSPWINRVSLCHWASVKFSLVLPSNAHISSKIPCV